VLKQRKAAAKAHVRTIRALTFCAHCGAQPIDWHSTAHDNGGGNRRVSARAARGESIARIDAEIAVCTPLCRSCHMKEDGRLEALLNASHAIVHPVKLCVSCGQPAKPSRKGLCGNCYARHRRRDTNQVYGAEELLMVSM
jgi:hypothetical protein